MRRKSLPALVLVLFAALAAPSRGQDAGSISGHVRDTSGRGVGGVTVAVRELGRSAATDHDGGYSIAGVPAGSYTLDFSFGDDTASAAVSVASGAATVADQTVDWALSVAETITVYSASRQAERITEAPAAVTVIPEQQIERGVASGQLPKLLEFTPGAEVTQSGVYDFNLNTRGFNSSLNRRVATLIDGRDPSVPFLGSQEWAGAAFPMEDLQQAELVRGPSAALYGANASSGVLSLITKRPKDSLGGFVRLTGGELDTVNGDVRWAGKISDAWYFKLMGGLHQSGDFAESRNGKAEYSRPCSSAQGITTDCLPQERVALDPVDDDEVKFASARVDRYWGNGGLLVLDLGRTDISGPVFQTGIGRVQVVNVERQWARLDYTMDHWDFLFTHNARKADEQTALNTGVNVTLDDKNSRGEIQTYWSLWGDRGRLVAGATYKDERVDSVDKNGPFRPSLLNPRNQQTLMYQPVTSNSQAGYAQLDWDATENLKLVLAARYDDSTLHDSQWSPKASMVWQMRPNHSLRLTYNEGFQVPNYSEFFLQADVGAPINLAPFERFCALNGVACGFDLDFVPGENPANDTTPDTRILALGNEDLEVETVKTAEIGYTGLLGNKAFVSLDVYKSKNENFVTDLLSQLGTPLGRINPNFGPYQPPAGMTPAAAAQLIALLQGALRGTYALLSNNVDGTPIIAAVSYTNFGTVDTQGADLGLSVYLTDHWTINGTYSWFDFEIKDSRPGLDRLLLPNSPENKASAGVAYVGSRFDASVAYRWVDTFRWVVGPFQGDVNSYGTADVVLNYLINDHWKVGVNVANALDDEHFEAFGGDILSRRALGYVTFRW